tara:strand:- start:1186 stop:1419 length:234 start_codon:yes stop_codon:yes gene_type:complete
MHSFPPQFVPQTRGPNGREVTAEGGRQLLYRDLVGVGVGVGFRVRIKVRVRVRVRQELAAAYEPPTAYLRSSTCFLM